MSHTCEFTAETVLDELEGTLEEDDFDLEPLAERIEQVLGAHLRASTPGIKCDDATAVRAVLQQAGVHDAFES